MNNFLRIVFLLIINLTLACTSQPVHTERLTASTQPESIQWQNHPCPEKGVPFRKYKFFGFDPSTREIFAKSSEDSEAKKLEDKPSSEQAWNSINHFLEEKGILAACPTGTTQPPVTETPEPTTPGVVRPPRKPMRDNKTVDTAFVKPITKDPSLYYAPLQKTVSYSGQAPVTGFKAELTRFLTSYRLQTEDRADELVQECPQNMPPQSACFRQRYLDYAAARRVMMGDLSIGDLRLNEQNQYQLFDYYCQSWRGAESFQGTKAKPTEYPGPGIIVFHEIINAEHTWPQSKFPKGEPGEKTDLHHIFPTDSRVNGIRGNWEFAEVEKEKAKKMNCSDSWLGRAIVPKGLAAPERAQYFEPPAAHKGNVARALFYFAARYNAGMSALQETYMRKWHEEDPPDDSEKKRNSAIYAVIGIRNPFVDHPEWVKQVDRFCRVKMETNQHPSENDCP